MIRLEESLSILRPIGDPALLAGPLIFSGTIMHLVVKMNERVTSGRGPGVCPGGGRQWFEAYAAWSRPHRQPVRSL